MSTIDRTVELPYDDKTNDVVDLLLGNEFTPVDFAKVALACLQETGLDRMDFRIVRDMLTSHVEHDLPDWAYASGERVINR